MINLIFKENIVKAQFITAKVQDKFILEIRALQKCKALITLEIKVLSIQTAKIFIEIITKLIKTLKVDRLSMT